MSGSAKSSSIPQTFTFSRRSIKKIAQVLQTSNIFAVKTLSDNSKENILKAFKT